MKIKNKVQLLYPLFMIFIILVVLITSSIASYSWFSGAWTTDRQTVFKSGEGTLPSFHAWVFDLDDEDSGAEIGSFDKTGQWRECVGTDVEGAYGFAVSKVEEATTGTEKYRLSSLHLGTVDNLLSMSNDNYFYMRFDVTDLDYMGRSVRVGYSVTEDDISFYDPALNLHKKTGSGIADDANIDFSEFPGMLEVDFAVSSDAYDPTNDLDDINALFADTNADGYIRPVNGAAPADVFTGAKDSPFYLYARICPEAELIITVTDYISIYMPCELLFDMTIELEFYDIHK